jgi:hypothetical protein
MYKRGHQFFWRGQVIEKLSNCFDFFFFFWVFFFFLLFSLPDVFASVGFCSWHSTRERKEKKKRNSYSKDDIIIYILLVITFWLMCVNFLSYCVHRSSIKSCVDIYQKLLISPSFILFFFFCFFLDTVRLVDIESVRTTKCWQLINNLFFIFYFIFFFFLTFK